MDAAGGLLGGALLTIASVSPWLLGIAIALHLLKVAAEARAWHGIVAHAHGSTPVRFRTTLGAFVGSIGANAFLPARVGEAFRVGVLRRRIPGSNVATIAATIVLETLLELAFSAAVIVALLAGGRWVGPLGLSAGGFLAQPVVLGAVAGLLILGALLAVVFRRPAAELGRRMARGFSVVGSPQAFAVVCGWKIAAWTLRIACVLVFLLAFHVPATIWVALVVIGAQSVAGALPLIPGNAGTQQAAFAVVLAGTAGAGTIVGFGVGMQAATAVADVVAGVAAVGLVAGRADLRAALATLRVRRPPRPTAA